MTNYVFIKERDNEENDYTSIKMDVSVETWPDVAQEFFRFLQCCGFHFSKDAVTFDIVDDNGNLIKQ